MTLDGFSEIAVDLPREFVALVTLNRPERLNALSRKMREELATALRELDKSPDVRSIVITGAGGRAFAAGQDLSESRHFSAGDVDQWIDDWTELFECVLNLSTPTIAVVDGYAVGAGFQLAAVCDFRFASESARFGMPEVDDAIPCITGMWALYELIGRGRVSDLILSGRMIDAREALEWGIVTRVLTKEEIRSEALALASNLAQKSPKVIELDKRMLARLMLQRLPEFEAFAKQAHTLAFESGDPQEAMARFLEKRAAGRSV